MMKNNLLFLSLATLLTTPLLHAAPNPPADTNQAVSNVPAQTISANRIIPELKVRNSSGAIKQMQISPDKHFLSLLLADGSTRVWDLDLGIQRPMIMGNQTQHIAIDAQRQILFASSAKGISSYEILTGKHLASLPVTAKTVNDLAISADGSLLLINSETPHLSLWDAHSNKLKWQQTDLAGTVGTMTFAPNNRYAAIVCHENGGDVLEIRELDTGKKLQTLTHNGEQIVFSEFDSDTGIEVTYRNGETLIWDFETAEIESSKKLPSNLLALDKTKDTYAYALENGSALITDAEGNSLMTIAKNNNPIRAVALLAQGKKLITATQSGQVFLWDLAEGKELLQLISTKQGWTVLDNKGRFDSSESAMLNLSWQAGTQEIPFDNIATKYYEPGLFASALHNEDYLIAQPNAIQKGISLPPKLAVSVNKSKNRSAGKEIKLTVDIYDQGGGIEDVNLYHNEKAINLQKAIVSDKTIKEQDTVRRRLVLKIKPTAGKNQVKASASNKLGIENQSNKALFNATSKAKKSSFRVASIGINQYSDKKLNLDYSVADAQSIEQLLTRQQFAKFTTVKKEQLYDQNATKPAIISMLRNLSQGEQQDMLVIYFAGHGISVNGEWYFLPYETTLNSDLNYFASVGISATEISEIFKDSKIQHILLMIDSCYSGASLSSFKKLQNSQRKFGRTISRSVGITIVTATRKNQQAAEVSELGHGLFTYVLSKGMAGEADFMPQDEEISAHELADFSTRTLPNFSKRYMGSAQEPTSFTIGNDFVLFDRH
jgi:WD40 repeat protein